MDPRSPLGNPPPRRKPILLPPIPRDISGRPRRTTHRISRRPPLGSYRTKSQHLRTFIEYRSFYDKGACLGHYYGGCGGWERLRGTLLSALFPICTEMD